MSLSVELSGCGIDLLKLLRMCWQYDDSVTDADIIDKALLCYFSRLVFDDEMVSYDLLVDAWCKYHAK